MQSYRYSFLVIDNLELSLIYIFKQSNFMAFRLGILAAIVAYRRRNGKTRLKTLK